MANATNGAADASAAVDRAALTLTVDADGIAWLTFDRPESKANILTRGVMERLDSLLAEVESGAGAGRVRALVVTSGKPGMFIAGADIDEIAHITDPAEGEAGAGKGQAVFLRLDRLPIFTVAAIDGICLGGGTELALACDYRIAADAPATRIGLPEIQLGIIPGFGGTTRLPRLVGLAAALPLILTGKPVSASRAHRMGLINERVHPAILVERSGALVREVLAGRPGVARDIVLINAAAALWIAGRAATLPAGVGKAAAAIDSGAASELLARLVERTNAG